MKEIDVGILIPAYNPPKILGNVAQELVDSGFRTVLVVNDGSSSKYNHLFDDVERMGAKIIQHSVNKGKGVALKTGFEHFKSKYPSLKGVVTVDADGQHHKDDVIKLAQLVAEQKEGLFIGAREFRKDIPLRSRVGNILTRAVFKLVTGSAVQDTQSGLRGISKKYLPAFIKLAGQRYEYEMNMLLAASRDNIPVTEFPIQTIYLDGNESSHFNPLFDSLKIYFLIIRFISSSLITAFSDYLLFGVFLLLSGQIIVSVLLARFLASILNFYLNKRFVFNKHRFYLGDFMKYYSLLLLFGSFSFTSISILTTALSFGVMASKVISEIILFPLNFKLQRDFVFGVRERE